MSTARNWKLRAAAGVAVAALGLAATPPAEAGRFRTVSWTPKLQPGQGAWLSVSSWLPKGARYLPFAKVWNQPSGNGGACSIFHARRSPDTPNTEGEPTWSIGGGLFVNPPRGDPYLVRARAQDAELLQIGEAEGSRWASWVSLGPTMQTASKSGVFHHVFAVACNRPMRKAVMQIGIDGGRFLAQSRGTDASLMMDWDLEEHSPYSASATVDAPVQLPVWGQARAMTPTISKTFKHRAFAFFLPPTFVPNTVLWSKGPWYPEAANEMFVKVGDTGYKSLWRMVLPFTRPGEYQFGAYYAGASTFTPAHSLIVWPTWTDGLWLALADVDAPACTTMKVRARDRIDGHKICY